MLYWFECEPEVGSTQCEYDQRRYNKLMTTEKKRVSNKIINDNNKIECRAECEAMNLIFDVTNADINKCVSFFVCKCASISTCPKPKRRCWTHTHRDCMLTLSKQSHRVFEEISYKWMRYRISRKMNGDMDIEQKDMQMYTHEQKSSSLCYRHEVAHEICMQMWRESETQKWIINWEFLSFYVPYKNN